MGFDKKERDILEKAMIDHIVNLKAVYEILYTDEQHKEELLNAIILFDKLFNDKKEGALNE